MNIINACAKYTGYEESIKALRFEIPGKGKNPTPTPIFIIHSFAAKETSANPNAFDKGENVLIVDQNEKQLARGLASFNSEEIDKIKGKQSKEIEKILGYLSKSEIIHKDDMVKL